MTDFSVISRCIKNMIGSILELAIGWFVTYRAPKMLKTKGIQKNIIKLIGFLLMIAGVVTFVKMIIGL